MELTFDQIADIARPVVEPHGMHALTGGEFQSLECVEGLGHEWEPGFDEGGASMASCYPCKVLVIGGGEIKDTWDNESVQYVILHQAAEIAYKQSAFNGHSHQRAAGLCGCDPDHD